MATKGSSFAKMVHDKAESEGLEKGIEKGRIETIFETAKNYYKKK